MPCDYVIDADSRLVRTRLSGDVTDAELLDHQRRLAADPQFSGDFSQLIDTRDVTSTTGITAGGVQAVARRHLYGQDSRRAIVAPAQDTFGLARMFEGYCGAFGSEADIHVFRNLADALAWLGVAG